MFACSDLKEVAYREIWHEKKRAYEANPNPQTQGEFRAADRVISAYLWNRTQAEIAEDRRKHPRAKRNQPVVFNPDKTRHLP